MPWSSIEHCFGRLTEKTGKQQPHKTNKQTNKHTPSRWPPSRIVSVQTGKQDRHRRETFRVLFNAEHQDLTWISSCNPQDPVMPERGWFHRQEAGAGVQSPAEDHRTGKWWHCPQACEGTPWGGTGQRRVAPWAPPDPDCGTLSQAFSTAGKSAGERP